MLRNLESINLKQLLHSRFLVVLICLGFFSPYSAFSQIQVKIDSLALLEDPVKKMWMAIGVAKELQNEDWNRTVHYLTVAEKACVETNDKACLADYYFEAGSIYHEKGLFDIALDHYLEASKNYVSGQSKTEKYKIDNNLGILYAHRNNVKKTLEYFNKVLNYDGLDTLNRVQILNNIGNFLIESSLPDSAIYYLNIALAVSDDLNDDEANSFILTNIARSYAELPDYQKATEYFSQAIDLAKGELSERSKSWVFVSAANYYSNIHQPDSAIKYGNQALNVLSKRPRADYIKKVSQAMYRAMIEKEDYVQAAIYFEKYDSALNEMKALEEKVSMDRLKLAQEFQEQIKMKDLEDSKRRFRLIIIGLVIALAIITLVALILRYRAKLRQAKLEGQLAESRRQELSSKLELKEKELVSGTMHELAKSNFLSFISHQLKEIKLGANKKETRTEIDKVIHQIKQDLKTDIWKEFDTHFTEIHESFYRELSQNHEDLTPRDMRLCALLKLNLSSKEIADLTGQSVKGIENARVRLRKKLNLTNTGSDLSAYLNSLGE